MGGIKTKQERRYQLFWSIFFIVVSIIAFIPVLRVISVSLSGKDAILRGEVFLYPVDITLEPYTKFVFGNSNFMDSFGYSIILMLGATVINLVMTVLLAYPLSRSNLKGVGVIMTFCVITMYLHPGTIPHYFNVKDFGLIDTVWALLIPEALSVYNMIIMRTAFRSIDESLYEAARIDGCSEFKIMYRIALPLSVPTLATLGLFYAVGRWNGITDQLYYISNSKLYTVQMALKQMIEAITIQQQEGTQATTLVQDNVKSASIVVSMTPMLVVYPFIQRFFTQGIMLGAVKG